jgi:hypothetical protein
VTTSQTGEERRDSETVSTKPPRRNARTIALFVMGALTTAAIIWVGVPIAQGVIHNFGVRDNRAEVAWRSVTPEFGNALGCARCHDTEANRLHSLQHDGIGCQSCHGALAEHEADPAIGVTTPSSAVCLKCHTKVDAQPTFLHAIVPADHYIATCLACHDPHTTEAKRPPVVSHPLKNLPACITCHGPGQFKARTFRHPDVTRQSDASCMQCHKAGSGPGMEATNG